MKYPIPNAFLQVLSIVIPYKTTKVPTYCIYNYSNLTAGAWLADVASSLRGFMLHKITRTYYYYNICLDVIYLNI